MKNLNEIPLDFTSKLWHNNIGKKIEDLKTPEKKLAETN